MKRSAVTLLLFLFVLILAHYFCSGPEEAALPESLLIQGPSVVLSGIPFSLDITVLDSNGRPDPDREGEVRIKGALTLRGERSVPLPEVQKYSGGRGSYSGLVIPETGRSRLDIEVDGARAVWPVLVIPGILSLFPPLLSIILALALRQVLIALFLGLWLGSSIYGGYDPLTGLLHALDHYCLNAVADPDNGAIMLFTLTLGGMVGVISKSGGTRGIVKKLTAYTNSPRGAQLAGWGLGVSIFFDDYANTLIVGNTMRPFTDRLRISREKLSYIVDSTAAPIASLFPISTWVGYQIGLLDHTFKKLGLEEDAYLVFIQSIPYASYSLLTICFVFLVSLTLRDFGPMLKSERRAVETGRVVREGAESLSQADAAHLEPPEGIPHRWFNALIPIACVLAVAVLGLYFSGKANLGRLAADADLKTIIGAADSFHVLMWAAFAGAFTAIALAATQRLLSLKQAMEAWVSGVKTMVLAIIILVLAWGMGDICSDLHTADYVMHAAHGVLSPQLLPVIIFLTAAFISFSTGTSWATMAILVPIVIPIAYRLCQAAGLPPDHASSVLLGGIGAILSGAVFGDHASPISDTTIMSSMASGADHIDHVRTQMPYACFTALTAILFGYLPAGFGFNAPLFLGMGVIIMVAVIFLAGKKSRGLNLA